jgi:hypothetical protein
MKYLRIALLGCVGVGSLGCGGDAFELAANVEAGELAADHLVDAGPDELAADVDADAADHLVDAGDELAADVDAGDAADHLVDAGDELAADVDAGDVVPPFDAGPDVDASNAGDASSPGVDAGPPPFLCVVYSGACSGAYPVQCFATECCNRACQ